MHAYAAMQVMKRISTAHFWIRARISCVRYRRCIKKHIFSLRESPLTLVSVRRPEL